MNDLTVQGALVGAKIRELADEMTKLRAQLENQRDNDPTPEGRAEARHMLEQLEEHVGLLRFGGIA